MVNYEFEHIPSPAEQALDAAADVYDLRNQLLFDRVGQEGMQALAHQSAGQEFLSQLEAEVAPEYLALNSLLKDQERNETSRDLFEGRSFDELNPIERERVQAHISYLREQSQTSELFTDAAPLLQAIDVRSQLDADLNRAFNTPVLSSFFYNASRQGIDTVTFDSSDLDAAIPIGVEGIKVTGQIVIKRVEGVAEARTMPVAVSEKTLQPVDMLTAFRDSGMSEEDIEGMSEWLDGEPCREEDVIDIATRLEAVRNYLRDQLQPE